MKTMGMNKEINIINHYFSAQCSPRHACPLKGSLLMQVHERPQGAPVLALSGDPVSAKSMQNHAPYACMAFLRKNGGILKGLLRSQFCTAAGVIQTLCGREFFTTIIARSRVMPESYGR